MSRDSNPLDQSPITAYRQFTQFITQHRLRIKERTAEHKGDGLAARFQVGVAPAIKRNIKDQRDCLFRYPIVQFQPGDFGKVLLIVGD